MRLSDATCAQEWKRAGEVAALDLAHGVAGEGVDRRRASSALAPYAADLARLARRCWRNWSSVTIGDRVRRAGCTATATRFAKPVCRSRPTTLAHASTSGRSCMHPFGSRPGFALLPPRMITSGLFGRARAGSRRRRRNRGRPCAGSPSPSVSAIRDASSRFQYGRASAGTPPAYSLAGLRRRHAQLVDRRPGSRRYGSSGTTRCPDRVASVGVVDVGDDGRCLTQPVGHRAPACRTSPRTQRCRFGTSHRRRSTPRRMVTQVVGCATCIVVRRSEARMNWRKAARSTP